MKLTLTPRREMVDAPGVLLDIFLSLSLSRTVGLAKTPTILESLHLSSSHSHTCLSVKVHVLDSGKCGVVG